MALLVRIGLAAALLASGCAARAVNQAQVFKPVTGVIQMEVKVPAGESVAKVQFQVNDKVVGEDSDPTDGYKAEIDTSGLEVDALAKIAAVGVRADGSNFVLRENFILIGAAEEDEAATDTEDTEDTEDTDAEDTDATDADAEDQ